MKTTVNVLTVLLAYAAVVSTASGASFLYAPQPLEEASSVSRENGVMVKEILIRKGDTLSGISRAYSGHASYFPQILLFNRISDPDLIYAGKTLLVPVSKKVKEEREIEPSAVTAPEKREPMRVRKEEERNPPVVSHSSPPIVPSSRLQREENPEQLLYEKAVKIYRMGSCEKALPIFEEFINKYPHSQQAADVSLYRADCYLKLAGE